LLAAFFDETGETLAKVANFFVELERSPTDISIVEAIFRAVHSLNLKTAVGIQTSTAKAQRRQEMQRFESKSK
jgi:chemotaxis protein histidine kinase CheA